MFGGKPSLYLQSSGENPERQHQSNVSEAGGSGRVLDPQRLADERHGLVIKLTFLVSDYNLMNNAAKLVLICCIFQGTKAAAH